jgi:NAD(P)-dependent dehydrogenase (short-subunit alcohol dehydrogenase family)
VDLRAIELDVPSQDSVDEAVARIIDEQGQLDVIVHNAGHMVVGSTSTRGGTPPYLGPYFAAKAAEDSLAVSYAAELARFGIDTVIIVPGSFTTGTNHFAHADLAPDNADPQEVAVQIARVVDLPKGKRPFRVHIDPSDDGAQAVNAVGDEIRKLFYQRIGLGDLLQPANQG